MATIEEYVSHLPNDVLEEIDKWRNSIRSTEPVTFAMIDELDPSLLAVGPVRDALLAYTFAPEGYEYDPNPNPETPLDFKEFPPNVPLSRVSRTVTFLATFTVEGGEPSDHAKALLGYIHWNLRMNSQALDYLEDVDKPTRLAELVASAIAMGIPGHFTLTP